jgi:hypothetical protein
MTERRGRTVRWLYVVVAAAGWWVQGIQPVGESRWELACRLYDRAYGTPPDMSARNGNSSVLSFAGVLAAMVLGLGGMVIAGLTHQRWLLELSHVVSIVCLSWAAVAGTRAMFEERDRRRWERAGRPVDWVASKFVVPGDRDLVYWALLSGVVLVLLNG